MTTTNSITTSTSSKGNQGMDNNSIVTTGAIITSAEVKEKRQQAVVLKYTFGGKDCTGVMHVSQFPSLDRDERDQLFAAAAVGTKFDNLRAEVEPADKNQGRRFTTVRLSGRAVLADALKQKIQEEERARQTREQSIGDAIKAVDGQVVMATVKKLAFSKDPQTKEETDHCFGAFLKTVSNGIEVSGLLHVSRMEGSERIERLLEAFQSEASFEVVAEVTPKGIAFSQQGIKAAKEAAAAAKRVQQQASERDSFLTLIRETLAAGTAAKMPFQAKVTENNLVQVFELDGKGKPTDKVIGEAGFIVASACGVCVKVSAADLAIPMANLRGTGHQVKLIAVSEQDGVITAKRVVKGS